MASTAVVGSLIAFDSALIVRRNAGAGCKGYRSVASDLAPLASRANQSGQRNPSQDTEVPEEYEGLAFGQTRPGGFQQLRYASALHNRSRGQVSLTSKRIGRVIF